MSEKELVSLAEELGEATSHYKDLLEEAKKTNPFYYYRPSTGDLTPEGRQLVSEFINERDLPAKLDGAIHAHASKADLVGVCGGNQSSKTTTGTINDLIKATGEMPLSLVGVAEHRISSKRYNRIRITCEDYTRGILNHNLPTIQRWVPREYLIDGKFERSWSDKRNTLTLIDPKTKEMRAEVEYMSNQADVKTFQGPPVDRLRYDEEPRRDIFEENLLRFVTSDKLDIELDMTPTNGITWVHDELFEENREPGSFLSGKTTEWFKLCSATNPKANLTVLREILKRIKDYETRKMRILGEWISLSGLIYGRYFKQRIHVIPPEKLGLAPGEYLGCNCKHVVEDAAVSAMNAGHDTGCRFYDWLVYSGIDAHEVKPSTFLWLGLNRDRLHVVDRCYQEAVTTKELKRDHAVQRRLYRYAFARCDPSADSDKTVFDHRNLYREISQGNDAIPCLSKAEKYSGSILSGVDILKQLLIPDHFETTNRPDLVILDRPENQLLISAMRTLQRDNATNEERNGIRDKILEGKHDHHACLRYIMQARLHWYQHEATTPEFKFPDMEAGF